MRSHTLVQVRLSVIVILNLIQEPDEGTLKLTTRPFLLSPRLNPFPPFPFSSPFTFLSSANSTLVSINHQYVGLNIETLSNHAD